MRLQGDRHGLLHGHFNLKGAFVATKLAQPMSQVSDIVQVSLGGQQKPSIRTRRIPTAEG